MTSYTYDIGEYLLTNTICGTSLIKNMYFSAQDPEVTFDSDRIITFNPSLATINSKVL